MCSKIEMRIRYFLALLATTSISMLAGCGGASPPQTEKNQGIEVLKTALEAWQGGQKVESLKDLNPALTMVDQAWRDGAKLARFEIESDGAQASGFDLSCPVKLWLGDGKKAPSKVRYIIALSPNRVITRDFGN